MDHKYPLLDLGQFTKAMNKKNNNAEKKEDEDANWAEQPLVSFNIDGINKNLMYIKGPLPYFLKNIESMDFLGENDNALLLDISWKDKVNEKIEQRSGPFKINLPFQVGDDLNSVIPYDYNTKIFYLTDDYQDDIKKYNKFVEEKTKKDAEANLAKSVDSMNFN